MDMAGKVTQQSQTSMMFMTKYQYNHVNLDA